MSTIVTIEGSTTPSTALARGERRTVQLTDRVQRLIDRGYVTIVDDGPVVPMSEFTLSPPEPVLEDQEQTDDGRTDTEREADENAALGRAEIGEPSTHASKTAWREFLTGRGVEYPESATRDELIALWETGEVHG